MNDSNVFLSVVVPVFNERDNVADLVREIHAALGDRGDVEYVFVDDASTDDTRIVLQGLQQEVAPLRVLHHQKQAGQSTAVRSGVRAARGSWVATLDGDGQNIPADILKLISEKVRVTANYKLFAGWRTQRNDSPVRLWSSKIANGFRSWMLKDQTPDTGCGIKLFERQLFLDLPYFSHMHRFLPALVRRAGFEVLSVPVGHRARSKGVSKYGVWNRLWVGIVDIIGVAWLSRRARLTDVVED
jgi:dolichol-phosphate mannosyltransferase